MSAIVPSGSEEPVLLRVTRVPPFTVRETPASAFGAWFLTAPVILAVVYFAIRPVLRAVAKRLRRGAGEAPPPGGPTECGDVDGRG